MTSDSTRPPRARLHRLTAVAKWLSPAVIAVDVVLVASGALEVRDAILLGLLVEGLLGAIAGSLLVLAVAAFRRARGAGADGRHAFEHALQQVLPGPVATIVWREIELFIEIVDRLRGRQAVRPGQVAISSWKQQRALMTMMGSLSVGEIVALNWVLPWEWLKLLALILGAYGTLWIVGLFCAMRNHPHVLGADALELRHANFGSVRVNLADVTGVRQSMRSESSRSIGIDGDAVHVTLSGTTLVELALAPGATVSVKGKVASASSVRFTCDEPAAAVDAISRHLQPRGPRGTPARRRD